MHLVIGIPARNEAANIAALAGRLEHAAALLPAGSKVELVLALQDGGDETRQRWDAGPANLPRRVLSCATGLVGKGRNVKLLIEHAREADADHLLLVDADLRDYPTAHLSTVVALARAEGHGLVLPLWCRAVGQGNTTNYLAAPTLFARYGAQIRQPLAGHMLLDRRLLAALELGELPDDYGIDVAITIAALEGGCGVGQVRFPELSHPARSSGSDHIMVQVARAAFQLLRRHTAVRRNDVTWPDRYWAGLERPSTGRVTPAPLERAIRTHAADTESEYWLDVARGCPETATNLWCSHLAAAIAEAPRQCPESLARRLLCPFFAHAANRVHHQPDTVEAAEAYVTELGHRVAERLAA